MLLLLLNQPSDAQTLTPSLFTNTQIFYAPTVTPGDVTLGPSLLTNEQVFYSPTVSQPGESEGEEIHLGNLGWSVSEQQLRQVRELHAAAEKTRKKVWVRQQESRGELVNNLKTLYGIIADHVSAETAEDLAEATRPHVQHPVSQTIAPPVELIDWQQLDRDVERVARVAEILVREIEAQRQEQDDREALQVILRAA